MKMKRESELASVDCRERPLMLFLEKDSLLDPGTVLPFKNDVKDEIKSFLIDSAGPDCAYLSLVSQHAAQLRLILFLSECADT